jgi:hypothetical protein
MRDGLRVGLYYAPALEDPLWRLGAAWLGRDAATNEPVAQPDVPGIAAITADPRGYGFHGTFKPPMRLLAGTRWQYVLDAAAAVAASVPEFDLPPLAVGDLDGFLALQETTPSTVLQALADACVAGLDHLRAPLTDAELARRRRNGLPPGQDANLQRWGYPYVFAMWFFHMTLTRRLKPPEHAIYRHAAEDFFAAATNLPRRVRDICLFVQDAPGLPFTLRERLPLRG